MVKSEIKDLTRSDEVRTAVSKYQQSKGRVLTLMRVVAQLLALQQSVQDEGELSALLENVSKQLQSKSQLNISE